MKCPAYNSINIMKTTFLYITFLFLTVSTFGQTQLFKDYDFNKGGYSLLGTFSESDKNSLRDSIGEFFINDTIILNKFKRDWTFEVPGNMYACGYHYKVYLCRQGKIIESLYINLNCQEIATDRGYFHFDPKLLREFYGKLKKPYRRSLKFDSISQAREYREQILKDSNLIMTPSPDWVRFEGEFDFTYKCPEKEKLCFEKEDSLKIAIKEEILRTYPGEDFELSDRGGSWINLYQIVSCNKSLSDKFNLYYRDRGYFGQWRPYKLDIVTYWIKYK
jgi:hypothetical protein